MKVFANFPHEFPPRPCYPVVTVGVFDGVHRGHQNIFAAALDGAPPDGVAVVTFDPHPRAVLGPPKRARLLSPLDERLALFAAYPLGAAAVLRFDQQLARMSYVDFVLGLLVQRLGARRVVLGYNVSLGHERQGNLERLGALGREHGFEVTAVPAFEVDGAPVSSTRIRHLLDAGEVAAAARLLGRPYWLGGTVVRGSGRGRGLGVPTANLQIGPEKLLPARGVYAGRVRVDGRTYGAALNIGTVPTFVEAGLPTVEVHILDFAGDLYGARLQVDCIERLRDERKFARPDELVAQIDTDIAAARRCLASDTDA